MKMKLALSLVLLSAVSTASVAATHSVTLTVPGMTCPTCPITVRKALNKVAGVEGIIPDVAKKTVTVTYDDSKTRPTALMQATANAGYPSTVQHQSQ